MILGQKYVVLLARESFSFRSGHSITAHYAKEDPAKQVLISRKNESP
jgi:hypothetical protein